MPKRTELTAKQRIFIKTYQLNGKNATMAAISAGYSVKNADKIGSQLLGKTRVRRAIEADLARSEQRLGIRVDKMLDDLYAIATAKISDFYRFNGSGMELKDVSEIDPKKLAAIESVSETVNQGGGSTNVKMHPKQAATVFLLKYYGKYTERQKTEHSGTVSLESLVGSAGVKEEGNGGDEGSGE